MYVAHTKDEAMKESSNSKQGQGAQQGGQKAPNSPFRGQDNAVRDTVTTTKDVTQQQKGCTGT
jgi:hypothetical protein